MPVVGFERYVIADELQRLAQRISDNIERNGQRASGKTQASLEVVDDGDAVALLGRKAFGVMETGRRGGRVPRNFADILLQWSIDKGIPFDSDRERKSFAYLLAKKIQKEGTQLFRDKGRTDVYSNEIPKTINNIARKLADEVVLRIESIKLNTK